MKKGDIDDLGFLGGKTQGWVVGHRKVIPLDWIPKHDDILIGFNPDFEEDGHHWFLTNFRESLSGRQEWIDYDIYDFTYDSLGRVIGWDRDFGTAYMRQTTTIIPNPRKYSSFSFKIGDMRKQNYLLNILLKKYEKK